MNHLPHFIIVGAMKSGSSSLVHHLRNHKKIHLPAEELHFFDREDHYGRGMDWYQQRIVRDKPPEAGICGEKTPTYSFQTNVAERIYAHCPHTKLIWVLRDPAKRAYSNYLHAYKKGVEPLSFKKAIRNEEKRMKKNVFLGYRQRSLYHLQIKRFMEYFPLEQMHFLLFEELVKPYGDDHVLNDLFHFLGVSSAGFTHEPVHKNKTIIPRFPRMLRYAESNGLTANPYMRHVVRRINFKGKQPGYAKMEPWIRRELDEYFKPYNEELEKLIGKDLKGWGEGQSKPR